MYFRYYAVERFNVDADEWEVIETFYADEAPPKTIQHTFLWWKWTSLVDDAGAIAANLETARRKAIKFAKTQPTPVRVRMHGEDYFANLMFAPIWKNGTSFNSTQI